MADSVLRRRIGAAAGSYASIVLGFLGTVVAAHIFSTTGLGLYAIVIASTAFFQTLLDLTIEEALIKFGFRYVTREDWGRLHRLFRRTGVLKAAGAVLAALSLLVLAAFSRSVFQHGGLAAPLAVAALIPLAQWPENVFGVPLMLHGRYDLRAGFLAFSMALRLAGIAAGAPYGLVWAIAGIAAGQAIATVSIMVVGARFFQRFPRAAPVGLGEDRREILRFIAQSTGATGMLSLRAPISPMLLGMVTTVPQVAYFRVAQAPQQGFNAVSAPIRLVLLAEQTRDWERGNRDRVFAGIRRYTLLAALGCAVLLPVLLVFMGPIVRLLFSPKNSGAIAAARIIVVAGAVQFLVGWSKSFAVTCGRPQLRIWTYGAETLVLVPLLAVLGWKWGAVGAAFAVLASSVVFALSWLVLYRRIRRAPQPEAGAPAAEAAALAELGALL
jgi:O-antigen/teichoic acid export membrane protein